MNTRIAAAMALVSVTLALGACGKIDSGRAGSAVLTPSYPAPLSEPRTSLSAPAAHHDYGPIPTWRNHPAPGTDAAPALAADADAAAARTVAAHAARRGRRAA